MLRTLIHNFQKRNKNAFVLQSLFTLILRITGVLFLFGFTVFLTQTYSPKIVGQYEFVRTFLLVVGSLCLLGFDQSILYFKGRLSEEEPLGSLRKIYFRMVVLLFWMSILLFLLFLCIDKQILNDYFSNSDSYFILLKATGILFFYGLTILNTEVFRALNRFFLAELFRNIFKYVPVIVGAVILLYCKQELYLVDVFLLGFIILALFTSGIILYFFRKGNPNGNHSNSFTYKEIFTKSYPIAISGMALFLLMSFDIFFLKKYWNDATVAFYSVAVKLMTILSMVSITVNITISEKIASYFSNQNTKELNKILSNSSRLIFLFTFPIVLVFCIFPEFFLHFFGKEYIDAKEALLILMIGQGITAVFGSAPVYLNMTGRQHLFQAILIVAVVINYSLNRFLIPEYGMTGAAIAFVSSSFFWNCTTSFFIYRKDKIKVFLN